MKPAPLFLFLALAAAPLRAGQRSSPSYSVSADIADAGGLRATSASYTHDGSAGAFAGLGTAAAPAETMKHGYAGQLFEVTDFLVNAAAATVAEAGTLQLAAWQLLDDATFLRVPASAVAWSVLTGPITGIDAAGLATAGLVYQNTPATVQGTLGGFTGPFSLTVLDSIADNFGGYAGDGLGDDWQVQYFGLPPNANAGPLLDPDGDGQTNFFEYTAGLVPTDANSVFRLRIENVPAQPGQKNLVFSPRLPDRAYIVKAKPSLPDGTFTALGSFSFADDGQERTVTDLDATGAMKFYTVEITKP